MASTDPSIPPEDWCMFFDMAREIRDKIYEFALCDNQSLLHVGEYLQYNGPLATRCPIITTADGEEPNRLKYVCKQIYHETMGVAPRVNELTFPVSYPDRICSLACVVFLRSCSQTVRQNLRKITVHEKEPKRQGPSHGNWQPPQQISSTWAFGLFHLSGIMALMPSCINYPKLDILIRLVDLAPANIDFNTAASTGYALALLTKRMSSAPTYFFSLAPISVGPINPTHLLGDIPEVEPDFDWSMAVDDFQFSPTLVRQTPTQLAGKIREYEPNIDSAMTLDNLRFFPAFLTFDETWKTGYPCSAEDRETWRDQMRHWHEVGF